MINDCRLFLVAILLNRPVLLVPFDVVLVFLAEWQVEIVKEFVDDTCLPFSYFVLVLGGIFTLLLLVRLTVFLTILSLEGGQLFFS